MYPECKIILAVLYQKVMLAKQAVAPLIQHFYYPGIILSFQCLGVGSGIVVFLKHYKKLFAFFVLGSIFKK